MGTERLKIVGSFAAHLEQTGYVKVDFMTYINLATGQGYKCKDGQWTGLPGGMGRIYMPKKQCPRDIFVLTIDLA